MIRKTISRKKASELLDVSTRSIDRWLKENRIEGFIPYKSSRVLIYLDSLTQENLQSTQPKFNNEF